VVVGLAYIYKVGDRFDSYPMSVVYDSNKNTAKERGRCGIIGAQQQQQQQQDGSGATSEGVLFLGKGCLMQ